MGLPPCHLLSESVSFLPVTCANHRLLTCPNPGTWAGTARQIVQHPKPRLGPGVQAVATEHSKPGHICPPALGRTSGAGSELQTNRQLLEEDNEGMSAIRAPRKDTKSCEWADGDLKVRQSFFPKPQVEVPNHRAHPQPRPLLPRLSPSTTAVFRPRHVHHHAPRTIPVLSPASLRAPKQGGQH